MKYHLRIFPHRNDKPKYNVIDLNDRSHVVFGTNIKSQLKIWLALNNLRIDTGYYKIFLKFHDPKYVFAGVALEEIAEQ
jgi:hypothetical protein